MENSKVEKGQKVRLHYKGTLDDGTVFDSSDGREPLEFVSGEGMVIKGFEDAVLGMNVGEEKSFSIEPEDAYGPRIEQLVQEVPIDAFGESKPEIGAMIGIRAPTGQVLPAKIVEVKEDKVKLDLNHPLAGKKLNFAIKIVDSQKLSEEEKEMRKHKHSHENDCSDCGHDHGGCSGC